ncbi:unnamed protein product [Sphenostylis stenocarpa]|uniref:Uncharacterized protein n=1 Tax=Sphenostylis stenocarpa TaxID=92480 RepID=A0AA86SD95_9FABA|nr:unnamed protein product [Sphenostylis stenocarpa]
MGESGDFVGGTCLEIYVKRFSMHLRVFAPCGGHRLIKMGQTMSGLGNGNTIRFWIDEWLPNIGCLIMTEIKGCMIMKFI